MYNHKQLGVALLATAGMGEDFEEDARTQAPLRTPAGFPKEKKVVKNRFYRWSVVVGGLGDIDKSFAASVGRRVAAGQLAEECYGQPEVDLEASYNPENEMIDMIDLEASYNPESEMIDESDSIGGVDREPFEDLGDPVSGVFSKYDELTDELAVVCR